MKFTPLSLEGAYKIELEPRHDARGYFARTWCAEEFKTHSLETKMVQQNMSLTRKTGTLRGMHFQTPPHQETKVVRCTRGRVYDVIVDLRKESPTHTKWYGIELSSQNHVMLYVPKGFAHGFLTLEDNSEVSYLVSAFYEPTADSGVRFNDPAFDIKWPIKVEHVSEKDRSFGDYKI